MDRPYLKLEKQGRVLIVNLNRPDERNALSAGLMKELTDLASAIRDDHSLIAVVLSGGRRFFSAGLDLRDPEIIALLEKPIPIRRRLLEMGPRLCRAWEDIPQVTIAALEGFCIGGAVSLVLACDFRVMAEGAFLRISEIDLGMNYSWGSLPRLVNLVGPARTKEWVILADKVNGPEAFRAGFAQWKAPDGQAGEKAVEIARRIAEKPQAPAFMTKQTVNALVNSNQAVGHMEMDQFALTMLSDDFQEGLEAFLNKRKPLFNKKLPIE
jgi:enoyl-CoA hydratase/carnithine racemase